MARILQILTAVLFVGLSVLAAKCYGTNDNLFLISVAALIGITLTFFAFRKGLRLATSRFFRVIMQWIVLLVYFPWTLVLGLLTILCLVFTGMEKRIQRNATRKGRIPR